MSADGPSGETLDTDLCHSLGAGPAGSAHHLPGSLRTLERPGRRIRVQNLMSRMGFLTVCLSGSVYGGPERLRFMPASGDSPGAKHLMVLTRPSCMIYLREPPKNG